LSHPDLLDGERPANVGVVPVAAFEARRRLWGSLEEAFPVRFEPRRPGELAGLDALISHREGVGSEIALPVLRTHAEEPADATGGTFPIRFPRAVAQLHPALHGQSLGDVASGAASVRPAAGDTVLAERDGLAMWIADGEAGVGYRSALLPAELGEDEVLRDRLRAGRFLALLPIVALLRELTGALRWRAPPLRASFMFDDPNLHWTSYGLLDYHDLASRAQRERYHVAIATVPLDGWLAHRGCARLFRESRQLSLLVHGNDHSWCELGEARTDRAALAIVAQALRRIHRLERRSGLSVARVMAPPHGRCSFEVFQALRRTGYAAACISRPYPWLERPPGDRVLAQWEIADVVSGLPVLPRYSLTMSREDIPLRAFLGQPLILYGHHEDLAGGAELLDGIAAEINRIGEVRWGDLASIARSSHLTRRDGDLLRVRMYTREADLELPPGVRGLAVELAGGVHGDVQTGDSVVLISDSSRRTAALGETVALDGEDRPLRVRLTATDAIAVEAVPAPRWRLWPRARRVLVESRDRLTPAIRLRQRGRAGGRRLQPQPLSSKGGR
jgi:hypothetical protein